MSKAKIEQLLKDAFNPPHLHVTDDSHKHAGHAGMPADHKEGTHFTVEIVAAAFEGKKPVERHRMIYAALMPAVPSIHALSIKAKTISET